MRYGAVMKPFDFAALQLGDEMRLDPDVERYARLSYQTSAAEIVSDPESWTAEQTQVYAVGDWRYFSKLRGYDDEEIRAFAEFLELNRVLSVKYGQDDVAWIDYAIQEQAGVLGLRPSEIIAKSTEGETEVLTLEHLYQRLKADLESYTQIRLANVERGAETIQLAGLLTQKYGYGLARALQLAAELGDVPNPSLKAEVDRCVARIDPHWDTTFKLRINAHPAGLLLTAPEPNEV